MTTEEYMEVMDEMSRIMIEGTPKECRKYNRQLRELGLPDRIPLFCTWPHLPIVISVVAVSLSVTILILRKLQLI